MACTYSISRVAWPTARTSTPVASGSRVPAWPILVFGENQRAARSTASREVSPEGLSRTSSPLGFMTRNDQRPGARSPLLLLLRHRFQSDNYRRSQRRDLWRVGLEDQLDVVLRTLERHIQHRVGEV